MNTRTVGSTTAAHRARSRMSRIGTVLLALLAMALVGPASGTAAATARSESIWLSVVSFENLPNTDRSGGPEFKLVTRMSPWGYGRSTTHETRFYELQRRGNIYYSTADISYAPGDRTIGGGELSGTTRWWLFELDLVEMDGGFDGDDEINLSPYHGIVELQLLINVDTRQVYAYEFMRPPIYLGSADQFSVRSSSGIVTTLRLDGPFIPYG